MPIVYDITAEALMECQISLQKPVLTVNIGLAEVYRTEERERNSKRRALVHTDLSLNRSYYLKLLERSSQKPSH